MLYSVEHYLCFHHLGYLAGPKLVNLYMEAHTTSHSKSKCYVACHGVLLPQLYPAWHPSPSSPTSTRWCPAPPPYVTINTDGSSKGNPGMSGADGVAHSATGEWLWGFSLHLGFTNNTIAELWGIREALL